MLNFYLNFFTYLIFYRCDCALELPVLLLPASLFSTICGLHCAHRTFSIYISCVCARAYAFFLDQFSNRSNRNGMECLLYFPSCSCIGQRIVTTQASEKRTTMYFPLVIATHLNLLCCTIRNVRKIVDDKCALHERQVRSIPLTKSQKSSTKYAQLAYVVFNS